MEITREFLAVLLVKHLFNNYCALKKRKAWKPTVEAMELCKEH